MREVAGLSERQRRLLLERLVWRLPDLERTPLSYPQEALWFLDMWQGLGSAYNIAIGARVAGRLDADRLQRALDEVVRVHSSLRTYFDPTVSSPAQIVGSAHVRLQRRDVSSYPAPERLAAARLFAEREAQTPFELHKPPLLRGGLIRLDDEDHVVFLVIHHMICDGLSVGLVLRDLGAAYRTLDAEDEVCLPTPAATYGAYARWQRQLQRPEQTAAEIEYWRANLDGLEPLELFADRPRPLIANHQGSEVLLVLDKVLVDRMKEVAGPHGASLHAAMLAAYGAWLARYCDCDDVAVGCPVSGRDHPEIDRVVGHFVNTVVLRLRMPGAPAFDEVLKQASEVVAGAHDHQHLPFQKLVEALVPRRHEGRAPFFNVTLVPQYEVLDQLDISDLRLEQVPLSTGSSKFDLSLLYRERRDGSVLCAFEYRSDLFDQETIIAAVESFSIFIKDAFTEPRSRMSEFRLARPSVAQEGESIAAHETIHRLALAATETEALVGSHRSALLEMDRRADLLAHQLQTAGVGPEIVVALYLSDEMAPPAALGVLKSGGAYIHLGLERSPDDLPELFERNKVAIVLVETKHIHRLPPGRWRIEAVDAALGGELRPPSNFVPAAPSPVQLACIALPRGAAIVSADAGRLLDHRALGFLVDQYRHSLELR